MNWYRLWGYPAGIFLKWDDWGWYYGTAAHAGELLGRLMQSGGTSYTYFMADAAGTPVFPVVPPQTQQPPFTIPGLNIPGWSAAAA